MLVKVQRLLFVSEGIIGVSKVDQSVALAITITDGAIESQGLREGIDRVLLLAQLIVGNADIVERSGLVYAVALVAEY